MSTIGHPLSDLSNLFHPFTFAAARSSTFTYISGTPLESFAPGNKTAGLPSHAQLMQWYAESAGWDPAPESKWGDAFGVFRNSVIMQGIAARYALRQASSAKAKDHATKMGPFGEFAWGLIKQAKEEGASHGKLKL